MASPEAGVGGESDRRGLLKRRAAPAGAKWNGAARRSRGLQRAAAGL